MILVTGCTGYIGFHLCEYLNNHKIPFIGIDNFISSQRKNIIGTKNFYKIDIGSKKIKEIFRKHKIKIVIHAAALTFPQESEIYKNKYFINNVVKTKKFIDICSIFNIKKFIFFSSSNVYDFNLHKIEAVKENKKISPKNYYGKSKFLIEKYIKKKKFSSSYILRLFNIAGYTNEKKFFEFKNKYRRILPVLAEAALKKKKIIINLVKLKNKLVYPGRDFVHIIDLIRIIQKIIDRKKKTNKTYNIGSGKLSYLDEIIKFFEKKQKTKIEFQTQFQKKGNLNYTLANSNKLKKELKFKFKFSFSDIIKSCLNRTI